MSLTKMDLVDSIHNQLDLPRRSCARLIGSLLEVIKGTLENGEDVLISGFGKFCVKDKGKRRGRNPQTGKDMMLESRRLVSFRCSPVLKNKINGKM